jgi:ribonucleoside-diphosphate reductase alpha subunit
MRVVKRSGRFETLSFDKVMRRIKNLATDKTLGNIEGIDCDIIAQKVIQQIYDGVTTEELDTLAADISIAKSIDHPGYGELASRIIVSNLHKSTPPTFTEAMMKLHDLGILNDKFMNNVLLHGDLINESIVHERDYLLDFFGVKTLHKGYLLCEQTVKSKRVIERPQYMWMRVAVALHGEDFDSVIETYNNLSLKNLTHATPTLFNAGSKKEQLSSCFLAEFSDSVDGIFKMYGDVAQISKHAGGWGLTLSRVRANGSIIRGTNGKSDGIVPLLITLNSVCRYINQGGKRNGSAAVFLEPWHADIEAFLEMKSNVGDPNLRARDLFYGLWIPDLFMKTVENDGDWYLMCPDECPGLVDAHNEVFDKLYNSYVEEGRYRKVIKARDLWEKILVSQTETGTPYTMYKDAVNRTNNQSNLGTITSSNLCCEIMLYHDPNEYAVCNIVSICLGNCVINGKFDYQMLGNLARIATINLNKVIDNNYYPVPETKVSNNKHRPIAIGVQGLYDALVKLRIPFESKEALVINKKIFECIQYNALITSCKLAEIYGPYESFEGSPASKGIFQHNMWGVDESKLTYDWPLLRKLVKEHGLRNSTLTSLPPTASTANIMGNTSSFETITSNFFTRTVLAGNFPIVNKYLVNDLIKLGMWTPEVKDQIIADDGSVQNIKGLPEDIKKLYKTTWETSQKFTITASAERAPFIDQTQSLNIFMANPTVAKLSSMHFYGWKAGLLTGMYYLRSTGITAAEKITVAASNTVTEVLACSIDNKEACMMCEG